MDALDDVAPNVGNSTVKTTKKRMSGRTQVRQLTMPKRPHCCGVDQDRAQTIYVYVKPGNKSLYLRVDGLDWFWSCAADEQHFQGVARQELESLAGSAVADYRVQWDFNAKVWEATVLLGHATGQSRRRGRGLRLCSWPKAFTAQVPCPSENKQPRSCECCGAPRPWEASERPSKHSGVALRSVTNAPRRPRTIHE